MKRTTLKQKSARGAKTHAALLKEAKRLYNLWIRLVKTDKDGRGRCVTCGKFVSWNGCDAGHFWHGLDFVYDNQHLQCRKCNYYLSGGGIEYRKFMQDKYGEQRVQELKLQKNMGRKYSRGELELMIMQFKEDVKEEKKKKGL